MDWKTIRVPVEDYEEAKERKEEYGVTWGDYINPHRWHSVFDEPKSVPDGAAVENDRAELIEDIRDQLERLDDEYEKPENDPVDYAEIETRMERVIERVLR